MSRTTATLIGFGAVLLWSLLALFTVGSAPVPPFQLNAICFAIGGSIGLVVLLRSGKAGQIMRETPLKVWAFGVAGLFGYHALYFSALRLAPAAEAGLIAYMWPLLIVLMSGLLPGENLRAGHILGAAISFAGAAMIVTQGGDGFSRAALPGYGLAALCALTWSSYSVLSRRFGDVPTETVAIFCLVTSGLSVLAHLAFETTAWPETTGSWASVIALGLGPVGLAFYIWDIGVKQGDIQMLGTASYAAPLLSTLVLIAAGFATASVYLLGSAALITIGAGIAAFASRSRGR